MLPDKLVWTIVGMVGFVGVGSFIADVIEPLHYEQHPAILGVFGAVMTGALTLKRGKDAE
jgi:hypothetical protein